jgi:hypothetical protein
MDTRKPVLCIALLASLFAAAAADAASGTPSGTVGITPGDLRLVFSPGVVENLPIDAQALAGNHCQPPDLLSGSIAKCRLVVSQGGSMGTTLASGAASWQPAATDVPTEPVGTSCGIWDTSLRIDGTNSQQVSPLQLTPDPQAPDHGTFAGSLEMNAVLHLANRTTGVVFDHSLVLGFALAGPWALATPDPSAATGDAPAKSNLILLSDGIDHCTRFWMHSDDPALVHVIAVNCEICLHSDAPVNPLFTPQN